MKKSRYFWPLFWIAVNLVIWSWASGFLQEQIWTHKPPQQPLRALEELNADSVRLIQDGGAGPAQGIATPNK